jgi:hypothetical protein
MALLTGPTQQRAARKTARGMIGDVLAEGEAVTTLSRGNSWHALGAIKAVILEAVQVIKTLDADPRFRVLRCTPANSGGA